MDSNGCVLLFAGRPHRHGQKFLTQRMTIMHGESMAKRRSSMLNTQGLYLFFCSRLLFY